MRFQNPFISISTLFKHPPQKYFTKDFLKKYLAPFLLSIKSVTRGSKTNSNLLEACNYVCAG